MSTKTEDLMAAVNQELGDIILCEVCGVDITDTYKGKGRKPKYCADHKEGAAPKPAAAPRTTARGDVALAVNTLNTVYEYMGFGLMLAGAHDAHARLAAALPQLQENNARYLESDKDLVRKINSIGQKGGRAGFILSNVAVLGPVAFIAAGEIRENFKTEVPEMGEEFAESQPD